MAIKVIAFIFLAFGLFKDYSRDKKKHIKAKVFHVFALIFLLYYFAGSFAYLGWIFRNFEKFQDRFYVPVGIISAEVHYYTTFFHIGLSLAIVLFTYNMIKRDDSARSKLIKVLPFIIPTETLSFYRGFQADGPFGYDYWVLALGLILMSALNLGLCYLYTRPFMVEFFKAEEETLDLQPEVVS